MGKTAKRKKAVAASKAPEPFYTPVMGEVYEIEGRKCAVRFINQGRGYLFPVEDDPDNRLIARHICFAVMESDGKTRRL